MPIQTYLWKVGAKPKMLEESHLASEQELENMIVQVPRMFNLLYRFLHWSWELH